MLAGGWTWKKVPTLPFEEPWTFLFTIHFGALPDTAFGSLLDVSDPGGTVVTTGRMVAWSGESRHPRVAYPRRCVPHSGQISERMNNVSTTDGRRLSALQICPGLRAVAQGQLLPSFELTRVKVSDAQTLDSQAPVTVAELPPWVNAMV